MMQVRGLAITTEQSFKSQGGILSKPTDFFRLSEPKCFRTSLTGTRLNLKDFSVFADMGGWYFQVRLPIKNAFFFNEFTIQVKNEQKAFAIVSE